MRVTALLMTDEVRQIVADALCVPVEAVTLTAQGAQIRLEGCIQPVGFAGLPTQTRQQKKSSAGENLQKIVEDSMIQHGPATQVGSTGANLRIWRPRREIGAGPSGYKQI